MIRLLLVVAPAMAILSGIGVSELARNLMKSMTSKFLINDNNTIEK